MRQDKLFKRRTGKRPPPYLDHAAREIDRAQRVAAIERLSAYLRDTLGQGHVRYRFEKRAVFDDDPVAERRKCAVPYRRDRAFAYPRGNGKARPAALIAGYDERAVLALFIAPYLFKLGNGIGLRVEFARYFPLRIFPLGGKVGGAVLEIQQPRGALDAFALRRVPYHIVTRFRGGQPSRALRESQTFGCVVLDSRPHYIRFFELGLVEKLKVTFEIFGSVQLVRQRVVYAVGAMELFAAQFSAQPRQNAGEFLR